MLWKQLAYGWGTYSISTTTKTHALDVDLDVIHKDQRSKLVIDVKEVDIENEKTIKIGVALDRHVKKEVVEVLRKNLDVFALSLQKTVYIVAVIFV